MGDTPTTVTGRGRLPAGVASALAVLLAAGSVAGNASLMRMATTSFCGTCARSALQELLGAGLALLGLWPAAWAVAPEVAPAERRAVGLCGAGSLAGWAAATAVACGWLRTW